MNLRHIVFGAILLLGLVIGPATPTVAQDRVSSTVAEQPSINGDLTVLLDVEDETVRIDAETSRRTRREYGTDAEGRRRLVVTIEEDRVDRPDGGQSIVRSMTIPDANGRPRATRRETEETVPEGGGVFRTQIEVSVPGVNRGTFVLTERVEQVEQRDGEQVLEIDRTTYISQSGTWVARERRTVSRDYRDEEVRAVESIYTRDGSGNLVLTEQIMSREWTGTGGREYRTEEIFASHIRGQVRSREPRLFQQVQVVRTNRSDGAWKTTREVKETRGGRLLVVERVIEESRPDGRGGTVVERETRRLDVNGNLQIVDVSRTR